jgi:hypothetical protein
MKSGVWTELGVVSLDLDRREDAIEDHPLDDSDVFESDADDDISSI